MPTHGFSIIVPAQAEGTTPAKPGGSQAPPAWLQMGPMVLIFVVMYLVLIRPQQKRQKEHRELVSRLKAGDRIVTNGGIYGTIVGVKDTSVMVEVAKGVEIEVIRSAVNTVVTEKDVAGNAGRA
ncbi:MAG: preprotein translocase subunit YajC [Victivallales bacterium]|jgi:preprotein translocase subunit YajC|nr:preprotein translocase subunit YajC [Victivallales bacterium]MBT7166931.1 preprotein translocase subunit YajC [Victivallales bacterium]MBT7299432.1 preprotein translocase subunit YajC [Victivallales bacterium]